MKGRVVSTKSNKTATVLVERIMKHPLYKKTFIRTKKYLVDDSIGVSLGDIVDLINCRPISKGKSWKITKVLGKSLAEIAEENLKKGAEEIIAEVMPEEKEKIEQSSVVSPQPEKQVDEKKTKGKRKKKGKSES